MICAVSLVAGSVVTISRTRVGPSMRPVVGAAVAMLLVPACFGEPGNFGLDDGTVAASSEDDTTETPDSGSSTSPATSAESSASATSVSTSETTSDASSDDTSDPASTSGSESGSDATSDATTSSDSTTGDPPDEESSSGAILDEESSSSTDDATTEAPPDCAPLVGDADTVALWHFDDGAGQTATDSSGDARHLQLGAAAGADAADPTWTTGRFGGGLAFASAASQYATRGAGNDFAANALSVELWVRTNSNEYAQIFTAGQINLFVALTNNGGGVDFGIGDGNNWTILWGAVPNGTLDDGEWHAIATTYDGATMRVYIDGALVDSMPANVDLPDPGDYKVGGRPANTFLDGEMDEVRLSDVARSAAEIAAAFENC